MKRIIFLILGYIFGLGAFAADSTSHAVSDTLAKEPMPVKEDVQMYSWRSEGPLGVVERVGLDTFLNDFNVTNPAERRTIALQHLGSLGSPAVSRIFSDRKRKSEFLFFQPYEPYYMSPEDLLYFNTKKPYSNISYYAGGKNNRKERRLNGVFTVNATPKLNFGLHGDWINAYGFYPSQSTRNYNAGLFASYMGRNHNLMASLSFVKYENYENGGLVNPDDVTDPKNNGNKTPENMAVFFSDNAWNTLNGFNAYLNYKYHLGFDREVRVTADSTTKEFVPVTSFIYTFRYENDRKVYREDGSSSIREDFFKRYGIDVQPAIKLEDTHDSVRFQHIKQNFGVTLDEKFNTFAKFGLAAYGIVDVKRYNYQSSVGHPYIDTAFYQDMYDHDKFTAEMKQFVGPLRFDELTRTKLGVGGSLSKHSGKHLFFNFTGEYFFKNEKDEVGSFNLEGNLKTVVNLFKRPFVVGANAEYRRECPDFLEERYFGNYISWNKELDYKENLRVEGFLDYQPIGLTLKAGYSNVRNYVYWNRYAKPNQADVNVFDATIRERLKIWYIHWDNELTYQRSSNESALPLPDLSLYSNFYVQYGKLFKVLTVQLGADLRYNTSYKVPSYMPVTGIFFVHPGYLVDKGADQQVASSVDIGDYPYMNVYLSFHLKTFRVMVEYNNLSKVLGWGDDNYLSLPGYAYNPSFLKFSISVNLAN